MDNWLSYLEDHKVDFVYPAHDVVVLMLAKKQDDLACKVIGSLGTLNVTPFHLATDLDLVECLALAYAVE